MTLCRNNPSVEIVSSVAQKTLFSLERSARPKNESLTWHQGRRLPVFWSRLDFSHILTIQLRFGLIDKTLARNSRGRFHRGWHTNYTCRCDCRIHIMKLYALAFASMLALCKKAQSLRTGAPICPANQPAPPQGPHGDSSGSLAVGNLDVLLDGQALSTGTTTLVVGQPVTVTIQGTSDWQGVLVRIPGATIDLPSFGSFREGDCPTGVGSITHSSDAPKRSVTFTLTMDAPASNVGLDINIVRSFSQHYYSQFLLQAIEDTTTESPTSGPTLNPVASPTTEAPTSAPVESSESPSYPPSQRPSWSPSSAPSQSQLPSISEEPSMASITAEPSYSPTTGRPTFQTTETLDETSASKGWDFWTERTLTLLGMIAWVVW